MYAYLNLVHLHITVLKNNTNEHTVSVYGKIKAESKVKLYLLLCAYKMRKSWVIERYMIIYHFNNTLYIYSCSFAQFSLKINKTKYKIYKRAALNSHINKYVMYLFI